MALFNVKVVYRSDGKPVANQRIRVNYHNGLGTFSQPQFTNNMGITSFDCANWRGKVTLYVNEHERGNFDAPGSVTIAISSYGSSS